jgi:hypothetical protein
MGDNRSALSAMRAARRSMEHCVDAAEELNHKLDEYIRRQYGYFNQDYLYEVSNVKLSEPSECNISSTYIKHVDVNGNVVTFTTEDGSKFSYNMHDTNIVDNVKPNKHSLLPKFVDASILKELGSSIIPTAGSMIAEVYDDKDTCKVKLGDGVKTYDQLPYVTDSDSSDYEISKPVKSEPSASNENSGINAEDLMVALRDIYDKYKTGYRDGFEIKQMIDLLKSENIMKESKGAIYHYQTVLRSVETFLDRSRYKLQPNELMVIYYGMYLLRIKGNEMLRKIGN